MTHSSDSPNPIVTIRRYVYYYSIVYVYRLIKLKWRLIGASDDELTIQTITEGGGVAFAHTAIAEVSHRT